MPAHRSAQVRRSFALVLALLTLGVAGRPLSPPEVAVLQSVDRVFDSVQDVRLLVASPALDGPILVAGRGPEGVLYDASGKVIGKRPLTSNSHAAFAPNGALYVSDGNGVVTHFDPSGLPLAKFSVLEEPEAIGVLSNGNLVVARVHKTPNVLGIYSPDGRHLRTFGSRKPLDADKHQNRHLNKGILAVGPNDEIYYVLTSTFPPLVRVFSRDGTLVREFVVDGSGVETQREFAERAELAYRERNLIGSMEVIHGASVDPASGHLWLTSPGSTDSAVLYEYTAEGTRVQEYALAIGPNGTRLLDPRAVVVRGGSILVSTGGWQVFRFQKSALADLFRRLLLFQFPGPTPVIAQGSCECASSDGNSCAASCSPVGAAACQQATLNCRELAQSSVNTGNWKIVGQNCATTNGSCSKNNTSGSCSDSLTICHLIEPCSTTNTGTFQLSCQYVSGSDDDEDGYSPPDDCNDSNPNVYPGAPLDFCADCNCNVCGGDANCNHITDCVELGCGGTPIILDIAGNGFAMTNAANGVNFDLNLDGKKEKLSWTAAGSDDAWLVLDRNGNGVVDDGGELFGNFTPQPASPTANGFLALAEFDKGANEGNGDGEINSSDGVFSRLRLWEDKNHNGIADSGELHSLPELGVLAIHLDYRDSIRVDQYGNQFRYRVKTDAGSRVARWAYDVFLLRAGSVVPGGTHPCPLIPAAVIGPESGDRDR
jgi:hypothetical protein